MDRLALALSVVALSVLTAGHVSAVAPAQADRLGPLPSPWSYQDIGAVGQTGNASYEDVRKFTVQSAGDNIWGDADSFGYVYQPCLGDCLIEARVTDQQDTGAFAKAGVMLRETLDANSTEVLLDLRPTGDLEFMTRPSVGASTSFIAGATADRPTWLRLFRDGPVVTGYTRANTIDAPWTLVGSTTISMGTSLFIGLAVTSQDPGRLNTSSFDGVGVSMTGLHRLPSDWYARDIGDTGAPGSEEYDAGTFTVRGAGADIWDTSDAFHYVSLPYGGQIVARVTSVQNTDSFAKAGVMIRDASGGSGTDAAHVILDVRPTGDIEFMSRPTTGATTTLIATAAHDLPVWLRLAHTGSTITGSISSDGHEWTTLGTATVSLGSSSVGLAVTSHQQGVLNTSTFDTVAETDVAPGALPRNWLHGDLGSTGRAGDASYEAGQFTVRGAGENIWGTTDSFHYASQVLDAEFVAGGNFALEHVQIVARVTSVEATDPLAKAGVMIRNGSPFFGAGPQAAHVILDVRPSGDIEFMSRPATGEPTIFIAGATNGVPVWLKLVRYHSTITGYISDDGSTWTMVGSVENMLGATETYHDTVLAGLAVTSRDPNVLNTSIFDHVDVVAPSFR
jgi:hypothetical protein